MHGFFLLWKRMAALRMKIGSVTGEKMRTVATGAGGQLEGNQRIYGAKVHDPQGKKSEEKF